MNLEIHTTIVLAYYLSALLALICLLLGIRSISRSRNIPYFKKKRDLVVRGWQLLFGFICLAGLTFGLRRFGEPAVYTFFEPSATQEPTPTITLTPTITNTPTITWTPSITWTLQYSLTPTNTTIPVVPPTVEAVFSGVVTPNPNAVFSPLQFARNLDPNMQPINPDVTFKNPIKHLYGLFSFDQMADGSQWSALWYRDGELVFYETKPWDGGSGGYGYTDWGPDPSLWLPGMYTVHIFNGREWKVSGQFEVTGDAPTPQPTATKTFTASTTPSITPSRTPSATRTLRPTKSPVPTKTITPTRTPSPTKEPTVVIVTAAG